MTAREQIAMRLYLIQPVEVRWRPIPGPVGPMVHVKMWDECTDEEKRPWLALAGEILADLPAMLAREVMECGT